MNTTTLTLTISNEGELPKGLLAALEAKAYDFTMAHGVACGEVVAKEAPVLNEAIAKADEMLLRVHDHLQEGLRIPKMPWPDPGAHGHEAAARAIHASYCAIRFKLIDAIAALTTSRCGVTALFASSSASQTLRLPVKEMRHE